MEHGRSRRAAGCFFAREVTSRLDKGARLWCHPRFPAAPHAAAATHAPGYPRS